MGPGLKVFIGLVCVAFVIFANSALAQTPAVTTAGSCIPHTPEQGPWLCDGREIHEKKCSSSPASGLDPIWRNVKSKEDAYNLLKAKYAAFNDAIQFSQWMVCQKFRVSVTRDAESYERISGMDLEYFRHDIDPYPLPWFGIGKLFGFYYSEGFLLKMDQYGGIQTIFVRQML